MQYISCNLTHAHAKDGELGLTADTDYQDGSSIAGYAGKKTTQFEPSDAPELTCARNFFYILFFFLQMLTICILVSFFFLLFLDAEFDPDSARFEKYQD
jgi:hypothetical protein